MSADLDNIKYIRSMMERSSKFLSLSGISGISAGICALIGTFLGHLTLNKKLIITNNLLYDLIIIASFVFLSAAASGLYFSSRKAEKNGANLWSPITIQILKDFGVPMFVGGLLCIIFITKNISFMVAPIMLIFYGLALIYAGARTYYDIKILGVCEITLGLLAALVSGYDLIFWAIGFGILHILYGIVIYYKYDMNS